MTARLVAWNPSQSDQFAQYNSRLELWTVVGERKAVLTSTVEAPNLSCFGWQRTNTNACLAYGSASGTVSLVKWSNQNEMQLNLKRHCNTISWNHVKTNLFAAGFEAIKG